jgi:YcxB-like protein
MVVVIFFTRMPCPPTLYPTFSPLLAVLPIVAVLLSIALYIVHYRRSLSRLRRMSIPQAVFEPAEEAFRITSDVGTLELSWRSVKEVWRFPHFWLLFISRAQFITLPLDDLNLEERQYVLNKIKANGGKIA